MNPWAPESRDSTITDDQQRFGIRCTRCARTQPTLLRGVHRCAYCGAPLPLRRWIAHPPPGTGLRRKVTVRRRPYAGPPAYLGGHPSWGFPPVTWRSATVTAEDEPAGAPRVRGLRVTALLAALTAAACLAAAGAEVWRFVLLLRGRTLVLDGGEVRASDTMVTAAGVTAVVLAVVTALAAIPLLIALHRAAASMAELAPGRTNAGLVARLVVPGWNLYGAGQVLMEIIGYLRLAEAGRRRSTRFTVPLWWLAWIANGLLVVATLVMAFGRSQQLMADTVEMHIAMNLVAALVAGLFAAVLISFERSWTGRGSHRFAGWSVRPPASSPRNRVGPVTVHSGDGDGDGGSGGDGEAGGDGDGGIAAQDEIPVTVEDRPDDQARDETVTVEVSADTDETVTATSSSQPSDSGEGSAAEAHGHSG